MSKIIEVPSENQFIQSSLNSFQLHTWDSTQDKEIIKPVKEFSKQIYKEAGYSEYETVDLDSRLRLLHETRYTHVSNNRGVEKLILHLFPFH